MVAPYFFDQDLCCWRRSDFRGIDYSDGKQIEDRIHSIIKNALDKSVFSEELLLAITDWPSEYHLSRSRHCLLRPLDIKPGEKVLELGCGCGAMTRYLGEIGSEVVGVEGGLIRARTAAQRCLDLSNVKVFLDDILEFESPEKYDWVLLIGVLEYSGLYSRSSNPIRHYINTAAKHLAKSGKLVIAIENKLGLKYFNGCSEDHVGIPFYGIQDLYTRETPITLGRAELRNEIAASGFRNFCFYYPFPDYKLPHVVVKESAFSVSDFNIPDLLTRAPSRDYSGSQYRLFNEALVFRSLHKNGLLEDFSHSFMVTASCLSDSDETDNEIAWNYSVRRRKEFIASTAFSFDGCKISVCKENLFSQPNELTTSFYGSKVLFNTVSSEYVKGKLALWRFLEATQYECSSEDMSTALLPWFDYLLTKTNVDQLKREYGCKSGLNLRQIYISGEMIDCTPFNLMEGEAGLVFIDREWLLETDLPFGFVLTRAVLGTVACSRTESILKTATDILETLCSFRQISVDLGDVMSWLEQEMSFQSFVTNKTDVGSVGALVGPTCVNPIDQTVVLTKKLENLAPQSKSQLFIDTGSGFNEAESIVIDNATKCEWQTFSLAKYPSVIGLRFDPLEGPCIVEILEAKIVTTTGSSIPLSFQDNNAILVDGKTFFFSTADPSIIMYLECAGDHFASVEIVIRYIALGHDALIRCITIYESKISNLERVIGDQRIEISGLATTVDALKNSTGWKITAPLRFLGKAKKIFPDR